MPTEVGSLLPISFLLRTVIIVLAPIAIYVLIIARIHRRQIPTMVSGVRDAAGVVLGFSGVLFYLAPGLLTGFNFWPRDIWLYNHYNSLKGAPTQGSHFWWQVFWVTVGWIYVFVVGGGIIVLLWKRRRSTAIYNVDAADFDRRLTDELSQLRLHWKRPDTSFIISDKRLRPGDEVALEIEVWERMSHVTLNWSVTNHPIRTLVEMSLAHSLGAGGRSEDKSSGMMIAAAVLFVILFVISVLFQVARYLEERW